MLSDTDQPSIMLSDTDQPIVMLSDTDQPILMLSDINQPILMLSDINQPIPKLTTLSQSKTDQYCLQHWVKGMMTYTTLDVVWHWPIPLLMWTDNDLYHS